MKARNVTISLFLVVVLFGLIFMKIRSEPGRKLIFNRNLSKVEYSQFALCLMNCQAMTANDITYVLRHGDIVSKTTDGKKQPCPSFMIRGKNRSGLPITVFVVQCGRATRIVKCYRVNPVSGCDCPGGILPVSCKKIETNAFPA